MTCQRGPAEASLRALRYSSPFQPSLTSAGHQVNPLHREVGANRTSIAAWSGAPGKAHPQRNLAAPFNFGGDTQQLEHHPLHAAAAVAATPLHAPHTQIGSAASTSGTSTLAQRIQSDPGLMLQRQAVARSTLLHAAAQRRQRKVFGASDEPMAGPTQWEGLPPPIPPLNGSRGRKTVEGKHYVMRKKRDSINGANSNKRSGNAEWRPVLWKPSWNDTGRYADVNATGVASAAFAGGNGGDQVENNSYNSALFKPINLGPAFNPSGIPDTCGNPILLGGVGGLLSGDLGGHSTAASLQSLSPQLSAVSIGGYPSVFEGSDVPVATGRLFGGGAPPSWLARRELGTPFQRRFSEITSDTNFTIQNENNHQLSHKGWEPVPTSSAPAVLSVTTSNNIFHQIGHPNVAEGLPASANHPHTREMLFGPPLPVGAAAAFTSRRRKVDVESSDVDGLSSAWHPRTGGSPSRRRKVEAKGSGALNVAASAANNEAEFTRHVNGVHRHVGALHERSQRASDASSVFSPLNAVRSRRSLLTPTGILMLRRMSGMTRPRRMSESGVPRDLTGIISSNGSFGAAIGIAAPHRSSTAEESDLGLDRDDLMGGAGTAQDSGIGFGGSGARTEVGAPRKIVDVVASSPSTGGIASKVSLLTAAAPKQLWGDTYQVPEIEDWKHNFEAYKRKVAAREEEISELDRRILEDQLRVRRHQELKLKKKQDEMLASLPRKKHRQNLTVEERMLAEQLLNSGDSKEVIADRFNIDITREVLSCLCDQEWLNDEVINYYMALLNERNVLQRREDEDDVPSCYFWSTFFYTKMSGEDPGGRTSYNYSNVRRWTSRKKIDVFSYDQLYIPVHVKKMHWTLGVVDIKERQFRFFDSLNGLYGPRFAEFMLKYLKDEHLDKKNSPLPEEESWHFVGLEDSVPQQANGSDCGVFTCQFAECLSDGRKRFDFTQEHIADRRLKMAVQIVQGKIE